MEINSYPKVYNLGHSAIQDLFLDEVIIEEKIDGSQFSFGIIDGELQCRSHHSDLILDAPGMFEKAVKTVQEIKPLLTYGWIYRAEYLQKPHHNTLIYDRVPKNYLIIFDVCPSLESYLPYEAKKAESRALGLECVPLLSAQRKFEGYDEFARLLDTVSCLGGNKIEGVVIKNYQRFGRDGKALMGKYVNEHFKEIHQKRWKEKNPGGKDVIQLLIEELRNIARWQKAVQHLKEQGMLVNEPKDIGILIKEIQKDTLEECENHIKSVLFKWAKGNIERGVVAGFAEWYKEQLAKSQFGDK